MRNIPWSWFKEREVITWLIGAAVVILLAAVAFWWTVRTTTPTRFEPEEWTEPVLYHPDQEKPLQGLAVGPRTTSNAASSAGRVALTDKAEVIFAGPYSSSAGARGVATTGDSPAISSAGGIAGRKGLPAGAVNPASVGTGLKDKPWEAGQDTGKSPLIASGPAQATGGNISSAGGNQRTGSASERPLLPLTGKISSGFGWIFSKTQEDWRFHPGIDLEGVKGAEVKACLSGKVVRVQRSEEDGFRITLEHPGGLFSAYSHCGEVLVKPGQSVKQGQIIARLGEPGLSEVLEGFHLHFEIRDQKDQALDPEGLIKPVGGN